MTLREYYEMPATLFTPVVPSGSERPHPVTDTNADSTSSPTRDFLVTERDMLGAFEVLHTASEEAPVLLELTDEEIVALDGAAALKLLGSPYLDQAEVDRNTAVSTALRSLAARHLVKRPGDGHEPEGEVLAGEGDPDRRTVQVDRQLAGVVTLRRIAEGLITSRRTLAGGTTVLAHHLFPNGGVLEEFISTDGFHYFAVPTLSVLPERIARFVDPFEDASTDGEPQEMTGTETEEDLDIDGARALTGITVVVEDGAYQATVIAMEGRVRVIDNGDISGDGSASSEAGTALAGATIGDVSAESLRAMVAAIIPTLTAEGDDPSQADDA